EEVGIVAQPVDGQFGIFEIDRSFNRRAAYERQYLSIHYPADKPQIRAVSGRADRTGSCDGFHQNIAGDKCLRDLYAADVNKLRADALLFQQALLLHQADKSVGAAIGGVTDGKTNECGGGVCRREKKAQNNSDGEPTGEAASEITGVSLPFFGRVGCGRPFSAFVFSWGLEGAPPQNQILMRHGLVSPAEAVVGAKRDLHVPVRGSDIPCAFLRSPLGDFRPAGTAIGSPADVGDNKSCHVFRLSSLFLR